MNKHLGKVSTAMTNWIGTPASLVVHTLFFAASFGAVYLGVPLDDVLLILTTVVSLEAIYLAIFIQMTVNRHTEHLEEVGADIEDIQEEVEDLGEDVQEISEDVEDISEDIEEIHKEQTEEETEEVRTQATLADIQAGLQKLLLEVNDLKTRVHPAANNGNHQAVPGTAEPLTSVLDDKTQKDSPFNPVRRFIAMITPRAKNDEEPVAGKN